MWFHFNVEKIILFTWLILYRGLHAMAFALLDSWLPCSVKMLLALVASSSTVRRHCLSFLPWNDTNGNFFSCSRNDITLITVKFIRLIKISSIFHELHFIPSSSLHSLFPPSFTLVSLKMWKCLMINSSSSSRFNSVDEANFRKFSPTKSQKLNFLARETLKAWKVVVVFCSAPAKMPPVPTTSDLLERLVDWWRTSATMCKAIFYLILKLRTHLSTWRARVWDENNFCPTLILSPTCTELSVSAVY